MNVLSSVQCNGCFACLRSFAYNCIKCIVPTSGTTVVQKPIVNPFNEATPEADIITGFSYIATYPV